MRRVVFNQKGGVGKSSITVNLAAISAAEGNRTLVVDLDPQCNASQYLLGMEAYSGGEGPKPNIGTFFGQTLSFRLKEKDPRDYVHATPFENLFVLPSNGDKRNSSIEFLEPGLANCILNSADKTIATTPMNIPVIKNCLAIIL